MNAPRVFRPESITADNLPRAIYDGTGQMDDNGEITVDLGALKTRNTLVVCLLLAMVRVGVVRRCNVRLVNVDERLGKLFDLYQLAPWFPEA